MPKDPAFLFYPGDWLGGTMTMTRSHKGAYMDLLMAQYNGGHLSLDDVKHVLGKDYDTMWEQKIRTKFEVDANGLYYNDKLDREINKRANFTASRRKNLGPHMVVHMENENENENEIEIVYKMYPAKCSNGRPTGKSQKDKVKIGAILADGKYDLKTAIELYLKKTDPQYYKNFATFLNQRPDIEELEKADNFINQTPAGKPGTPPAKVEPYHKEWKRPEYMKDE